MVNAENAYASLPRKYVNRSWKEDTSVKESNIQQALNIGK